jgi:magnesium chelatase subunit ChlD-like protein
LQQYLLKANKTLRHINIKAIQQTISYRGIKDIPQPLRINALKTVSHSLTHDRTEVQYSAHRSKADIQIVFLIDSSASMVKDQQIAYIKGLIDQTIARYKGKRLLYAAIALTQGQAQLVSPFTVHTAALLHNISVLPSGGKTNLKAAFTILHQLVDSSARLYIFTDGQINSGGSFEETVSYYNTYLKKIKEVTVIDHSTGFINLGLSKQLATAIKAKYIQR